MLCFILLLTLLNNVYLFSFCFRPSRVSMASLLMPLPKLSGRYAAFSEHVLVLVSP